MAKAVENAVLPSGVIWLPGHLDAAAQALLLTAVLEAVAAAPFYTPSMPRTGKPFSVRMSNCGPLGWVSDRAGYRYQPEHPETGRPWPAIPAPLLQLWQDVAPDAPPPEACLINHYTAGTKLGLHRDEDEQDRSAPVVSVSLGDEAVFVIGGLTRDAPKQRITLRSGDVLLMGGPSRLIYHGIDRIVPGSSALVPFGGRINLTLRRVTVPELP
jgi:DNA oxidative demethylase